MNRRRRLSLPHLFALIGLAIEANETLGAPFPGDTTWNGGSDPWCGMAPASRSDRFRWPRPVVSSRPGIRLRSVPSSATRPEIAFDSAASRLLLNGMKGDMIELQRATAVVEDAWRPIATVRLDAPPMPWPVPASRDTAAFFRVRRLEEPPAVADDFALIDTEGRRRHLRYHAADTNLLAIVLVFTGHGIPPDDPRIRALIDRPSETPSASRSPVFEATSRTMTWLIASSPGGGRAGLAAQAEAAGLAGSTLPVLHDPENVVARLYGVTATPSCACIRREDGTIFYRGALGSGTGLDYLTRALDQLGSGVADAATPRIEPLEGTPVPAAPATPDYGTDIVPILRAKCIACHRPGTPAPWSMTDHAVVKQNASPMLEAVLAGHMPPWGADPEIGSFSSDRSLAPDQLAKLVAWLKAGAPRGSSPDPLAESKLEPPPRWPEDLGEPDVVLRWPEQNIKALGSEPYRYADLALPTDRTVWIRAARLRPSNHDVTHHLVASRQRRPGSGIPEIAGYAPGWDLQRFPVGTGRRMNARGVISLEMHYTPNGTAQVDTPELALWLSSTPPGREYVMDWIESIAFRIAPNDPESTHTTEKRFDRAFTIHAFTPHMHLRGASMKYEAIDPRGKSEALLSVPHYDFLWQNTYTLTEPKRMPAGTRIRVTARYDNSALNPNNPDPNRVVWWGEQSRDEMLVGFIDMTWD